LRSVSKTSELGECIVLSDLKRDENDDKAVLAVVAPHQFLPPRNGGHWGAYDFCEYSGRLISLSCICLRENEALEHLSFQLINVLPSGWRKYLDPTLIIKFNRFFREKSLRACVVIQPYQTPLVYVASRMARIRFVVYAHNLEYARFRSLGKPWWRLIRMLEKKCFKWADLVLFVSKSEMHQAIVEFGLKHRKCLYLPPVIGDSRPPAVSEKNGIFTIIFFADFSYEPNQSALLNLVQDIDPLLAALTTFTYRIEIYGRNLSTEIREQVLKPISHIEYLGFVDDIDARIRKADVLVNPVVKGGGVQIKILKALAAGTTVVASESGCTGISMSVCAGKLHKIDDGDWPSYVDAIKEIYRSKNMAKTTPKEFYDHYFWRNNMPQVLERILGGTQDDTYG